MPGEDVPFNIRADAFAGAAQDYQRYRPSYPAALLEHVCAKAKVSGNGRLLDLGCGPGSLALPLARRFAEVWALDREPGMIEAGRTEAARLGVGNIRWLVGRAEDCDAPAAGFELVTMGQSFHRFDQRQIVDGLRRWLRPGGHVAAMGGQSPRKGEETPWRKVFQDVWARYEPPGAAAAHPAAQQPRMLSHEIFAAEGFADVSHAEFRVPHVWTVASLVGSAFSASTMTRRVLGARATEFEADVRRSLLALNPRDEFPETLEFWCAVARVS